MTRNENPKDINADNAHRHERVEWLDGAKGICILLVVMFYAADVAVDRVGSAGWLQPVVDFARPFRMPDFFLLSGLLLPVVVDRPWRRYLDRKVLHFGYFYVLWVTILVTFRGASVAMAGGWGELWHVYLLAYIRPYSMLWFIYMLAIFFVVTKLLRKAPVPVVWIVAAAFHLLVKEAEFKVWEKFAQYYVFFYTGYVLSTYVFRYASIVESHRWQALAALGAWAVVNGLLVFGGYSHVMGVNLGMALAGSAAVIAVAVMLMRSPLGKVFAYCGAHSIVIYLAFYIPLAATSKILVSRRLIQDGGLLAILAMLGGVLGALAIYWLVRNSFLAFLFKRPKWVSIDRSPDEDIRHGITKPPGFERETASR